MTLRHGARRSENGFALVVAILALLLLTFLGLTLAATTSTELQIASNQRWNEQAYYNAEAGLELGKRVLMNANWGAVVWPARINAPMASPPPVPAVQRNDSFNVPPRTFENAACDDDGGGAGYGWVLDDGTAAGPYQNVVQWRDANGVPRGQLNGSFTLWIRPRLVQDPSTGAMVEDPDVVVLTSEGTAPYTTGFNAADPAARHVTANRAVQVLELTLSSLALPRCGKDEAQAGGDAAGSGMKACDPTPSTLRIPGATGGPGGALGSGNETNVNTR